MKTYITFGQSHVHSVNGKVFDKARAALAAVEGEK